jgi:hypothetical protein
MSRRFPFLLAFKNVSSGKQQISVASEERNEAINYFDKNLRFYEDIFPHRLLAVSAVNASLPSS